MKKVVLILIITTTLFAEDIGSLFVGFSTFGSNNYFPPQSYKVEQGISAGFLLPINVPFFDMHYKVRAAYHPVYAIYAVVPGSLNYISAVNTLLCGKALYSNNFKTLFVPQIGLGLVYENIYDEWGTGYLYNLLFIDLSIRMSLPELTDKIGVMINREHGFASSINDFQPQNRTHVSLVLSF